MEKNTINDALDHFGMGRLNGNALRSASGETDKKHRVWLPMLYKNENHINVVHDEYILEINLRETVNTTDTEPKNVFTRERGKKKEYEIKKMGEYQQILYDKNRRFSVHRKLNYPQLQEDPKGLFWDNNIFASSAEAQKKADELFKIAEEEGKKQQ